MTTQPLAAAATGLPEPSRALWDIANDIDATAGDIKHLIDVLAAEVSELTAPADTPNYGRICRANAVARALEALAKTMESQLDDVRDAARQEARS